MVNKILNVHLAPLFKLNYDFKETLCPSVVKRKYIYQLQPEKINILQLASR